MILIHNNSVLYAGDFQLTEYGLISEQFIDQKLNTSNSTLFDLPAPQPWIGNGWTYENGVFTIKSWWADEIVRIAEEERLASVPKSVNMRQARLALLKANLLADVNVAISQAPEVAKIEWEYATEVYRAWPTLLVLQGILDWSDEVLDNLFIEAAKL